jgi:selenide,water dikinase
VAAVVAAAPQFAGLRALAGCGGCAAKAPPEMVALLTSAAAVGGADAAALVGLDPADDAAVYALDAERALVATVDVFPPVVDDADDYGAVAAANAVSDIYAMGGRVAFALAVSGFPAIVPPEVVATVNRAAATVIAACGGRVLGGHSVRCTEPLFGLCVLGFVPPGRVWRKRGALPGDVLLLSKPLGTGLLLSSRSPAAERVAVASMRLTNQGAAAALQLLDAAPHAVTDVSGFGLVGHACEMALQSGVQLQIDALRVPLLRGALDAAEAGVRTSAHRAPAFAPTAEDDAAAVLRFADTVPAPLRALLHDPQTSGGLLAAVAPGDEAALVRAGFTRIGEVVVGAPGVSVR